MSEEPPRGRSRSLAKPKLVATGALGVLALIFIFENSHSTDIRLIIPVVSMPVWLALLAVFVVGGAVGYTFARRRK